MIAASRNGISKIAKIDPKTEPIKVGPSLILFCIALPKYEPINMLPKTTTANVNAFKIEES